MKNRPARPVVWCALALFCPGFGGNEARAADRDSTCAVPSAVHAAIQQAIDDESCGSIVVAAGIYEEALLIERTLLLSGPSAGTATVRGRVAVAGPATIATLTDLVLNSSCAETFVSVGAQVVTANVDVRNSDTEPCPSLPGSIFDSGFESGDTSDWSVVLP